MQGRRAPGRRHIGIQWADIRQRISCNLTILLTLGLEASLLCVSRIRAPSCLQGGSSQALTATLPLVPAALRLNLHPGTGTVLTRCHTPGLAGTSWIMRCPTDSQPFEAGRCSWLRLRLHVALD